MLCKQCGVELPSDANFCLECGSAIDRGAVALGSKQSEISPKLDESTGETLKNYTKDVAREAGELSKSAVKSDLGKKMLAGAGIGAVVALPLPFVGPAIGAVVGAGIVAFRRLTKD